MNEYEKLSKLKLKQPKGLKKFILNNTDYITYKYSRPCFISTIELWNGKLLNRVFAFRSMDKKNRNIKTMQIEEVCRRLEGYSGCQLRNVDSTMGGKKVFFGFECDEFYINKTEWFFNSIDMFDENEIIKELNIPYCKWEQAKQSCRLDFFRYICAYRSEPKIELLVNSGLTQYVHCYKKLNIKEKSLSKIFRVNDYWVQYLDQLQYSDIMLIRNKNRKIKNMDDLEKVKKYEFNISYTFYNNSKLHKYLCPKVIDYVKQFDSSYAEKLIYDDYLKFCEENGHDMSSYNVLLPKDLHKAHDREEKLVKVKKNERTKEKFEKVYMKLLPYVFSKGKFVIVPCESLIELENESNELHHCVRTYADRYMDGKTNIMFVRDINHVTMPLYTLEFNGKDVIQFRAKNNNKPPADAISFIKDWADQFELSCWRLGV